MIVKMYSVLLLQLCFSQIFWIWQQIKIWLWSLSST